MELFLISAIITNSYGQELKTLFCCALWGHRDKCNPCPKFKKFASDIFVQQSPMLKHGEMLGISEVPGKCRFLLDPLECIIQGSWFSLSFVAPDIYFLTGTGLKLLLPKWRPDQGEKRLCSAPLSP